LTTALEILVVDDHPALRQGLIGILRAAEDGWEVSSASNAEEALALAAAHPFDAGIVDMSMPGMNGLELVRALRSRGHRMPLLMLSMHAEDVYAMRSFKAGANGYITKDRASEELVAAVRKVLAGGTHVSPSLMERVVVTLSGDVQVAPHAQLSDRELDILQRLGAGHSVAEVADQLGLAAKTVMNSRTRIQDKLGLTEAQALSDYAVRHGLIPPP